MVSKALKPSKTGFKGTIGSFSSMELLKDVPF